MKRTYQLDPQAKKKRVAVNLDAYSVDRLTAIQKMLEEKYIHLPSLSLLFQVALLRFAQEVGNDPRVIEQAYLEMLAASRTKREQRLDS
jgi:hypothetical protein